MISSFVKPSSLVLRVLATDETRTSTTTLTDLTGMSFTVAAGETWQIEGWFNFTTAGVTGGYLVDLATPSGTTRNLFICIGDNATLRFFLPNDAFPLGNLGGNQNYSGNGGLVTFNGTVFITTSGTLSMQAAQGQSDASPTTFKKGTYIKATRL